MRAPETVALRATAPGAGGIAVVEVLGRGALAAVRRFIPVERPGRLYHGRIVDEVIARYVPRSATGEPAVEISCHGGAEPVRAVIGALGVREVDRAFVLERAVAARRLDRTRVEAMLLLPGALTKRAAAMLAAQAAGALTRAVRRLRRPDALVATAALGCALVTPRRVAIAGRPNVGKSTLFNALVERDRALVSPQPGSTRDPVEETIAIDGVPLLLADTAGLALDTASLRALHEAAATPPAPPERMPRQGLAPSGGVIEQLSVERARMQIARADLVLLLRDAPAAAAEREFRAQASRPVLEVRTKTDLSPSGRGELGVCAPRGEGIDRLRRAILRALGLAGTIRPGAAAVFTDRQRAILEAGGRSWKERLLWGPAGTATAR